MPARAGAASYLVLGGSGSGKSEFAEELAAGLGEPVVYLATGKPEGAEMAWRVQKHRESRPSSWPTVEAPRGLVEALENARMHCPVVLLEDVGSLVTNCLPWIEESGGEMAFPREAMDAALGQTLAEVDAVLNWCGANQRSLVLVSSEVGLGLLPSSPVGRLYKDVIGKVNQHLAARVTGAYLVVAGLPLDLKAASRGLRRTLNSPSRTSSGQSRTRSKSRATGGDASAQRSQKPSSTT
jgi:adenosylcobinamide kinase / adenosylcobinamide-phosphate guanylyltransferase